MPIIVFKVIALIFQSIEGLVFNLPPRPATPHEVVHVPRADAQVGHPTKVLHLALTHLPILDEIDSHVSVRGIECHSHSQSGSDGPHAQHGRVAHRRSHAWPARRRLYLREQIRMIAVFHTENIVQPVDMQCLDVGCMGTEAVFGHDELEVGMVLTQLGNEAFGGVAFTIIFGRAVLFDDRLWHQGESRSAGPDGPAPHPTFGGNT